jgi:hypothetical protein
MTRQTHNADAPHQPRQRLLLTSGLTFTVRQKAYERRSLRQGGSFGLLDVYNCMNYYYLMTLCNQGQRRDTAT